jgi:hypothetical protein
MGPLPSSSMLWSVCVCVCVCAWGPGAGSKIQTAPFSKFSKCRARSPNLTQGDFLGSDKYVSLHSSGKCPPAAHAPVARAGGSAGRSVQNTFGVINGRNWLGGSPRWPRGGKKLRRCGLRHRLAGHRTDALQRIGPMRG